MIVHPRGVLGHKAKKWHQLRSPGDVSLDSLGQLFDRIRAAAEDDQLPVLTCDRVEAALENTKARAGQGVDQLSPTGMQRLPPEGLL
eukprot:9019371-Pyramimonas_sp.AAC.1